ncbi:MAG: PqqD family protein [Oscillospiraceae bacterium]|nr:PqqD family protein [Oscillospiraceae bacterium]
MGDFDTDSLAAALCEAYEVDTDTARADVDKLLTQWQELGIVE